MIVKERIFPWRLREHPHQFVSGGCYNRPRFYGHIETCGCGARRYVRYTENSIVEGDWIEPIETGGLIKSHGEMIVRLCTGPIIYEWRELELPDIVSIAAKATPGWLFEPPELRPKHHQPYQEDMWHIETDSKYHFDYELTFEGLPVEPVLSGQVELVHFPYGIDERLVRVYPGWGRADGRLVAIGFRNVPPSLWEGGQGVELVFTHRLPALTWQFWYVPEYLAESHRWANHDVRREQSYEPAAAVKRVPEIPAGRGE